MTSVIRSFATTITLQKMHKTEVIIFYIYILHIFMDVVQLVQLLIAERKIINLKVLTWVWRL
jgi:hypothetical protein